MQKFKSILYIFVLCFISHNVFKYIRNPIITILFPINESIWEHTKIIPTSTLIYTLIYLIKNKNLNNNFLLGNTIASIVSIFLLIIIYTPLYILFKEICFMPTDYTVILNMCSQ